jgi:energy-coupling factor transport system permease protein
MNIKRDFTSFHVLTPLIIFLIMLIITFSTDNPVIIGTEIIIAIIMLLTSGNIKKLKNGFLYFIPFAIFIIIFNMAFVSKGSIVLFSILNKRFTLESMIYAVILAFKLLVVFYLFMTLDIMIDSDRAVSYFSSKMPKSTLTLMIGLKLIPEMKERFKNLMDIYSIRGLAFNKKTAREKTKSYIPILSILLEDSLESSFDIGEAAFTRGFLSTKRSVYDRQVFNLKDYVIIFIGFILMAVFLTAQYKGYTGFDIYEGIGSLHLINYGVVAVFAIMILVLTFILILSEEKKHGIYRN